MMLAELLAFSTVLGIPKAMLLRLRRLLVVRKRTVVLPVAERMVVDESHGGNRPLAVVTEKKKRDSGREGGAVRWQKCAMSVS
mmetsp:Transcript_20483/g.47400  ORF Transcript_20483/g.47400 Transcript_20483/m.47400 type:complete len:83 (+) Transcript_20483:258-506(+)